MKTTIVITTKNRKEDLRRALCSALAQTVISEILVLDDGSNDGTSEMIRSEFLSVRCHSFSESKGYIIRRNEAAHLATGDIIISIDDDAEFSSPFTVEQTVHAFSDSRIGAVAIPYIEPEKENRLMQMAPDERNVWLTDRFIGTAHALRKDLFLNLGGYREALFHQGEEGDYCIRLLQAGHHVRLGRADPIIHHESPKRDHRRMDYYGCRNNVLFVWQNIPMPFMPYYMLICIIKNLFWTVDKFRFLLRLQGIYAGIANCSTKIRKPVKNSIFSFWRSLRKPQKITFL